MASFSLSCGVLLVDARMQVARSGGLDRVFGTAADESFAYNAVANKIFAGAGQDILHLSGGNQIPDLTVLNDARLDDFEVIDITGTGNNTLRLTAHDVLAMTDVDHRLRIEGDRGDVIIAADNWRYVGSINDGERDYLQYQQGVALLEVASAVMRDINTVIDLSRVAASDSFRVIGEHSYDGAGRQVAALGDINGDGFTDYRVSAIEQVDRLITGGLGYVIFGSADGTSPVTA